MIIIRRKVAYISKLCAIKTRHPKIMTVINILLDSQPNPLKPIISLLGFAIAMIWFFTRSAKKDKKDENKSEDDKNKMQ